MSFCIHEIAATQNVGMSSKLSARPSVCSRLSHAPSSSSTDRNTSTAALSCLACTSSQSLRILIAARTCFTPSSPPVLALAAMSRIHDFGSISDSAAFAAPLLSAPGRASSSLSALCSLFLPGPVVAAAALSPAAADQARGRAGCPALLPSPKPPRSRRVVDPPCPHPAIRI